MKKIILVDGNNLLFRSYYATSYSGVIMRNSKGFPTNGLYGFINMMNKIIDEEKPSYIMVAFDKGKTFRHDKYESYKAGRKEMPLELKLQFPKAKEVLDALSIKHFEIDNYEADDIIGTLAKKVDLEDEFIATIISSDKDLLQLISDDVEVKLLKTKGYIRFNKEVFRETYKVDPINMIDLKALMGDMSDHIKGVKGIGEKTAISLLEKYQTLDNLYKHLEDLPPKTKEKLENDKENAYMSYDIATIYKNVDIPFTLEDCKFEGYNKENYIKLLEEFEFKSLLKKITTDQSTIKQEETLPTIDYVDIKKFDSTNEYAFYIEIDNFNYNNAHILGVSFRNSTQSSFIEEKDIINYRNLFENDTPKLTYDVKKSFILLKKMGITLNNCNYDTMIASYLLDYKISDDIAVLMNELEISIESFEQLYGTLKKKKEISLEEIRKICNLKCDFVYNTKERFLKELENYDEMFLFKEIEMPLSYVLADMELTGINVDKNYLLKLKDELELKIDSMAKDIYKDAGIEFNIMSFKQLGEILFDKLQLPYPKKKKKDEGYSTSKEILEQLTSQHVIVNKILEYRMLNKLYANYVVGLLDKIKDDGKVHTIFNQCLTRTGRLSSVEPNLQNIPIRSDYTKLIRKAFIPCNNSLLMSSDYSQIELRVFAALSKENNLIQAFKMDKDIHTKTAADIFKVNPDNVTKDMRRTAKAVNFGILYGISSFGLSKDLQIDINSAKHFIDNYLETYPGISDYMEKVKRDAYKDGCVKTIMNRRRVINELKSNNYVLRSTGERMALNTPIQGSAADILKKAMVDLYNTLNEKKLKSKILIQVHDELVLNVYNDELDEVTKIVKNCMENVIELSVPLKVDIEVGSDWYEAK